MAVKPEPLGAPPPLWLLPHVWIVPLSSSAAKAVSAEKIVVNPEPVGAPLPPLLMSPHAWMVPLSCSAANADFVE